MTKLRSVFSPVVFAQNRNVHWSDKGGWIKNYHSPNSGLQDMAKANFAEAATQGYGLSGFAGRLPIVAATVSARISHQTVPGLAQQISEQSRQARHQAVPGRIQALRASAQYKLGRRGGGGGAPPPGAPGGMLPPFPY